MPLRRWPLFCYGLFGLPLAFVALPVYVYAPQFYATGFGLPLSLIGVALLAARAADAFVDPLLGLLLDRTRDGLRRFVLIALPLLAAGFAALFQPAALAHRQPFLWLLGSLACVYAGFSLATIAHQSWGAALSQAPRERARIAAVREACGLVGVLLAAALPVWLGMPGLVAIFVPTLLIAGVLLWGRAPRARHLAAAADTAPASLQAMLHPLANSRFRWLFAVFTLNGTAAAIPATLFLFFAQDRLQLGDKAGLYLLLYFATGAASLPAWVRLSARHGEARAWMFSMLLNVAAFIWACFLDAGSYRGFALVCAASGMALGADLALPPALLAAVIGKAGDSGRREGAYFGIWSWATKMNLALAAGIALPLLQQLGYTPGTTSAEGLRALTVAYALVPCILKLGAAALLWRAPLRSL